MWRREKEVAGSSAGKVFKLSCCWWKLGPRNFLLILLDKTVIFDDFYWQRQSINQSFKLIRIETAAADSRPPLAVSTFFPQWTLETDYFLKCDWWLEFEIEHLLICHATVWPPIFCGPATPARWTGVDKGGRRVHYLSMIESWLWHE